jgi:hypothetical protein
MNSLVISATKTQIFSGHGSSVRIRKTSFKMGKASPDIICSGKLWFGCLTGHPAAMSGLASDVRSSVHCQQAWFVTNPALGETIGSAFPVMTVNA